MSQRRRDDRRRRAQKRRRDARGRFLPDEDELADPADIAREYGITYEQAEDLIDAIGAREVLMGDDLRDYLEVLADELDVDIHALYELWYGYSETL